MKTLEQKIKAYDEAYKVAENIHRFSSDPAEIKRMEEIFPELKESEDERIRKALIKYYSFDKDGGSHALDNITPKQILAWLEKQGEKFQYWKPSEEQLEALDYAYNSCPDTERGNYYEGVLETIIDDLHKLSEKQGEQKLQGKSALEAAKEEKIDNQNCVKPVDKVEPKFKVGDWITNGDYTWKVVEVKPLDYILQSQDGNIVDDTISYVDEQFHSFTIEDAKDGDILCSNQIIVLFKQWEDNTDYSFVIAHAGIDVSGKLQVTDGHWLINNKSKPATKEQRDTLFKAMADAGYTFDFEKKELKKIEQKHAEWSEEDERRYRGLHNLIYSTQYCDSRKELSDWLKSLKDRAIPQPKQEWSEKDKKMIETVIANIKAVCKEGYYVGDVNSNELVYPEQLFNWLLSLKDRIQPQPKQEWNEEDEDILNTTINHFEIDLECTENDDIIRWLKSLRPHNKWKPSDEQMLSLERASNSLVSKEDTVILRKLLNDLKKL